MKQRLLDPVTRSAYVRVLRTTGNHVLACESSGARRSAINDLIRSDKKFAAQVDDAKAEAVERLEGEAYRRAVIGIEEPVFWQGMRVDTVRRYSDGLLVKLLEANHGARFGRKVQVTGKDGGPLEVRHDLSKLTMQQLQDLESILATTGGSES